MFLITSSIKGDDLRSSPFLSSDMKLNNRKIVGIVLILETLLALILTFSFGESIFGTEHISEWEGEDESVVLFCIYICLYFGLLSLIGLSGIISYFIKGKVWKFITKFLTFNAIAIIIVLCTLESFFVEGLISKFIGLTLTGLSIWGFVKLHAICKVC